MLVPDLLNVRRSMRTTGFLFMFMLFFSGVARAQQSVMVNDLTASEVKAAVAGGKTTVIYGVGGVQSYDYKEWGDVVVTDFHNLVSNYVVRRVAETLGNALGYNAFPFSIHEESSLGRGTVSLKEETFAAVVRDLVRSAVTTGFKHVIFLSDHGGRNQDVLKKVVQELDSDGSTKGARVFFFPVYEESKAEMLKYVAKLDVPEMCRQQRQNTCSVSIDDSSEASFLGKQAARRDKIPSAVTKVVTPELGKILVEQRVTLALEHIRTAVGQSQSR